MKRIEFIKFENRDFDSLLKMGQKLWKNFSESVLENLLLQTTESDKYNILIAKGSTGKCVGFSTLQLEQTTLKEQKSRQPVI